jgi:hypothetical protein
MKVLLCLFGRLRLIIADKTISSFPTQRSGLILARLARANHKRLLRDSLALELWPEDDLEDARVRFRQELSRLRRVLGEYSRLLIADRTFVGLDADAVQVDVDDFLQLVRSAELAPSPRERFERYQRALELAAAPFCEGLRDEWVLAQRKQLAEMANSVELPDPVADTGRLVGREFEVRFICDLLSNHTRVGETFVHVVAPTGFGKSVLLAEVVRRLQPTPPQTIDKPSAEAVRACLGVGSGRPLLCAGVRPLGIPGEKIVRLHPLPVPRGGTQADLAAFPSVRLYLDSAQAAGQPADKMDGIANLVKQLEGWPLPILLAGRRAAVYPAEELLRRDSGFYGLLADRREVEPERHRSFEQAMRWNLSHLPPGAREFFPKLAQLGSPFSAAMVEENWASAGVEALEVLLEFGFVERTADGFRIPEPILGFVELAGLF